MGAYNDMAPGVAGLLVSSEKEVDTGIAQEAMTPGVPVFSYNGQGNKVWKYKSDVTKLVFSGDLGASNSTVITINGTAATAVVYATSHAATMAAILVQIKAVTIGGYLVDAVLDTADTNNRTILVRTKGVACVASGAVTGGSAVTITATTGLVGSVFRGIVALQHGVPTTIGGSASFAQYDAIPVAYSTDIWAQAGSGSANAKAYIDTTTGLFTGTAGLDAGCRFLGDRNSDGVALVRTPEQIQPLTYGDRF